MGYTPQQQAAIDAQGKVIVSASAGSGKTTVMIEKIVNIVLGGTPVSEILAVTYTRKAASSMKEKLRKKLIEKINDPSTSAEFGRKLREQLNEVPNADISTIHSFCAKLIRAHFFKVEVDGKFGVLSSDTAEENALKSKALDKMFEEAYASKDNKDFLMLLSVYFRKKTDNELRSVFTALYEKARNRVGYRQFFETQAEKYSREAFDEICARLHALFLEKIAYYKAKLAPVVAYFERAWDEERAKYEQAVVEAEAQIKGRKKKVKEPTERAGLVTARLLWELVENVEKTEDFFALPPVLEKGKIPRKETARKDDGEERLQNVELLDVLKKKIVEAFETDLLPETDRREAFDAYLRAGELATALAKYLLIYDDTYKAVKQEKGLLDFSDLEHYTLQLLSREDVSKEIHEKYRYVFVDEYQDVNPVQEAILNGLYGDNVFLVGDVKQSIYGFRGSESKYFNQKYAQYKGEDGAHALDLSKNFRSAKNILRAVNLQFTQSMTEENGSVDYKNGHQMDGGDLYGENLGRVQLHLIGKDVKVLETPTEFQGSDTPAPAFTESAGVDERAADDGESDEAQPKEVYSVKAKTAEKTKKRTGLGIALKNIIDRERGRKWFDFEAKPPAFKEVKYSDIAILTRKNSSDLKRAMEELSEAGIPVSTSAGVNVCDYPEIKTLIDILKYIDNSRQDVPLCSALVSVGGLSPDELSKIRLAYPDGGYSPQKSVEKRQNSVSCFREACERYALEKNDTVAARLKKFFAYFQKIRVLSTVRDAGSLLSQIITDARLEAQFLLRSEKEACLKRIRRFIDEANSPEPLCVHDFLDKLADLEYKIEYNENGGENSVHLMTMHSSKGLEYPVVIINDLNESFGSDKDRRVYVNEKYGLAPQAFDRENMLYSSTVTRLLHEKESALSSVADELNIYYVALTRAKYALHVMLKNKTPIMDAKYAKTQADFTDFGLWDEFWGDEAAMEAASELPFEQPRQDMAQDVDEQEKREIIEAYGWCYAYGGYENLPVKRTATKLLEDGVKFAEKQGATEDDCVMSTLDGDEDLLSENAKTAAKREAQFEGKRECFDDEDFDDEDFDDEAFGGQTSIDEGIAYHAFLEQFDFSLLFGGAALSKVVETELLRMKNNRLIDSYLLSLLKVKKCVEILKNPIFKTLQGCRLLREQQFLAGVTANEVLALKQAFGGTLEEGRFEKQGDEETIIFQGAIDLLAIFEDGTARVIDYKYSARNRDYLKEHYALQLALYRLAVSKITKIPIEKIGCSIVNIYRGFEVDMDGAGTR
ncbi:MAG: UvrD-helicase domain-containing protein [Clostridia bacterium]|nr:UvrD-helicase domain-containing protein [Clostridia bacterium]